MKTDTAAFRFQLLLYALICLLGYLAPWDHWLHLDDGQTLWLWLASVISRTGWLTFSAATVGLLVLAVLLSFAAAALRTWARSRSNPRDLGIGRVRGQEATAGSPRQQLGPMHVGLMLHTLALALLMPPSGALIAVVLVGILQFQRRLGGSGLPPRRVAEGTLSSGTEIQKITPTGKSEAIPAVPMDTWGRSFLSEIYMWGVACSFLALGWRYNALVITQAVIVSLGISILVSALLPTPVRGRHEA